MKILFPLIGITLAASLAGFWIWSTRTTAPVDPCQFLSTADVEQIAHGAQAGVLDRSKEAKHRLTSCTWRDANGQIAITAIVERSGRSAREEALSFRDGFVDPGNPKARESVRVEMLDLPAGEAAAVVESADPAQGRVARMEYVTVRGKRVQCTLMFGSVPGEDRAAKLQAIKKLAGVAVARM